MKLLIDMNLSGRWIGLPNHAGWEAVLWSTVGSDIAADSEIMAFAAENEGTPHPVRVSTTRVRLLPLRAEDES